MSEVMAYYTKQGSGKPTPRQKVADEEKEQYYQPKTGGYEFDGYVGDKIRGGGIENLSGRRSVVEGDAKTLDADKLFISSSAIIKLPHIYGKCVIVLHEVVFGFSDIFAGMFQLCLIFREAQIFRLKVFLRVESVLPPKK